MTCGCGCEINEHSFSSYMGPSGPMHVLTCHDCEDCRDEIADHVLEDTLGVRVAR